MILGLLAFAGTNAVCRTLFSSAVVSQFVAYTIAIIGSRFGSAFKSDRKKGAFSLGILVNDLHFSSFNFEGYL
jgi:hypothetical protein